MNTILNRNIFTFGIPLLLIGFMIILAGSSVFQAYPEALSTGITLDLVFTVPVLYFLLIRKKEIPKITIVPFFILGIVTASLIIPEDHQLYLSQVKQWVLPLVEITVFFVVIFKVTKTVKSYKKQKNKTPDFYTALKQAASEVLPARVSPAFATEIAMFYYGFFNWKKRKLNTNEFSYHKNSGTIGLLSVIIFLVLIETLIAHILLERWSPTIAWILSALSIYTSLQIFGIIRSMSKRPIAIEDGKLKLRYGLFSESVIPLADIEYIESSSRTMEFKNGTRSLSPLKEIEGHNIIVNLKREQTISSLYGFKKTYKTIVLYVDEQARFKTILENALQHNE